MGFLERAMQRPTGQPQAARVSAPGSLGSPTASRPAANPVAPAVAMGAQGRPPTSPATAAAPSATPASSTMAYPNSSTMAYPKPPQVGASAPSTAAPASTGGAGPFSAVSPVIQKTTTTHTTQPAPQPLAPAPAPVPRNFKGMPSKFDMQNLQPGEQGMTPWGPAMMGEDGTPKIQFTPEGEQAYRQAVVLERKKVRLPAGFEGLADSLPVEPGQSNYDPFSGKWS